MRAESRALGQALLDHQRVTTARYPPKSHVTLKRYLIPYGDLCRRADVPHLVRVVGGFLEEVASWCEDQGFPPLNSLAINSTLGMPGDGYDNAGGFKLANWPADARACVRFTKYPSTIPG